MAPMEDPCRNGESERSILRSAPLSKFQSEQGASRYSGWKDRESFVPPVLLSIIYAIGAGGVVPPRGPDVVVRET